MCGMLGLRVPSLRAVVDAVQEHGFQAVPTCFSSRGIRSDVPAKRLASILQQLVDAEDKKK
jgi:tRNA G26 N,N-dimethylase Trm1